MALKDHGVRRTGKEGANNRALTGGAGLCGPDQHFLKAKVELDRLNKMDGTDSPGANPAPYDWQARQGLYKDMAKLEKRKNRGGSTFSPQDAC